MIFFTTEVATYFTAEVKLKQLSMGPIGKTPNQLCQLLNSQSKNIDFDREFHYLLEATRNI